MQPFLCMGGDNKLIVKVFNLLDECDESISCPPSPFPYKKPAFKISGKYSFQNTKKLPIEQSNKIRDLSIQLLKEKNSGHPLVKQYEQEKEDKEIKELRKQVAALEQIKAQKEQKSLLLKKTISELEYERENPQRQRSFIRSALPSNSEESLEDSDILISKNKVELITTKEISGQKIGRKRVNQSISEKDKLKKQKERKEKIVTESSHTCSSFSTPNQNKAILVKKLMRQRSVKNRLKLLDNLGMEATGLNHSSSNLNDKESGPYLDKKRHLLVGKIDNKSIYIFCPCTNNLEVFYESYAYPPKSIDVLKKDFSCKANCPYYLSKISNIDNEHHCADHTCPGCIQFAKIVS